MPQPQKCCIYQIFKNEQATEIMFFPISQSAFLQDAFVMRSFTVSKWQKETEQNILQYITKDKPIQKCINRNMKYFYTKFVFNLLENITRYSQSQSKGTCKGVELYQVIGSKCSLTQQCKIWKKHNQEAFIHQQLSNLRPLMRRQMNKLLKSIFISDLHNPYKICYDHTFC